MRLRSLRRLKSDWRRCVIFATFVSLALMHETSFTFGQPPPARTTPITEDTLENPPRAVLDKQSSVIREVLEPELIFRVALSQSKVVRTKLPISRIAITDPGIIDVNEFSPTEIEVVARQAGKTTLTFWFRDANGQTTILRYLVLVESGELTQQRARNGIRPTSRAHQRTFSQQPRPVAARRRQANRAWSSAGFQRSC